MDTKEDSKSAESVNYDDAPIAQTEIDGVDYRVDPGLGSVVAISQRPARSWEWTFVTEARWDGRRLRAKGLEHSAATELARALAHAMNERDLHGAV